MTPLHKPFKLNIPRHLPHLQLPSPDPCRYENTTDFVAVESNDISALSHVGANEPLLIENETYFHRAARVLVGNTEGNGGRWVLSTSKDVN